MRVLGCKSEAIAAASNLGQGTLLLLLLVVVEVVVGEDFPGNDIYIKVCKMRNQCFTLREKRVLR